MLRDNGVEIKSIQEEFQGIGDDVVIKMASEMNLVILTFDSDYGELIFKYAQSNPPAVIYFRGKGTDPLFAGRLLLTLLSNAAISFANSFTVVEEKNIRQRFYKH